MKNRITLIVFSFLFWVVNAQTKTIELPFHNYFLWYNGTIGEQAIKAKISVIGGAYDIYYAYNHSKKWIHLNEPKIEETTITSKAGIPFEKYTDGFVTLELDDLRKPLGQFTSPAGEKLPITLEVALKPLPTALKNTSLKNEFAPLALNLNIKADSINVYYAERSKADSKRAFEKQTYTAAYKDGNNQITYVDINYDGYLDISIGNAIYLFNTQLQRFEVENSDGDMYPGIEYMGAYNLYEQTFESSHFRTIMWYKAINGVITPYETEYYTEYHNADHLVEVSENRIRYVNGVEKYSHLDLYLKENNSIGLASDIVVAVIGTTEIIEGVTLILRYPSTKNVHYEYHENTWHYLFEEIDGKKTYPILKEFYDDGTLKYEKSYDEEGRKTGKWISYYPSGNVYSINTWKESQRDWSLFYENGALRESGSYTNERKTGEWLTYDTKGCLTSIGTIKDGAYTGERRKYHMGKLSAIEQYKNKKKTGKWLWYRDGDRLHQEQNYLEGEAHGEFKSFFKNGNLIYIRFYDRGKSIGAHKEYYESGAIKLSKTFDNGITIEERGYYESGNLDRIKTFSKNKNVTKGFFENGALSYVGQSSKPRLISFDNMVGGNHIGIWKYYHDNGKLNYKGKYEEGKRVGKWKGWHDNGKRKFKGKYVADEKIGKRKYYDEKGKLKNE